MPLNTVMCFQVPRRVSSFLLHLVSVLLLPLILIGGGTLFPYAEEKIEPAGGRRALAVRVDVPTVDLPRWILK